MIPLPTIRRPAHRPLFTTLGLCALLAGCADPPTSQLPDDGFPFEVDVRTSRAADQRYFTVRIRNTSGRAEPNATLRVQLVERGLVAAGTSATTGLIQAGETREATVSFASDIRYGCYEWKVSTSDGRSRVEDTC